MQKRALVILSRYLWPIDGGRKESLNHYLKELHDNFGYEVTILCFLEAGQKINKSDIPYYIKDLHALNDVGTINKTSNLVKYTLFGDKWPIQCSLYYSKENEKLIRKYVDELKPNLVFTEMIRTCSYYDAFKETNAIKIANLDDLLSVRYERQSQAVHTKASVAGAYNEKLPKFLQRFVSTKKVRNTVLKMESTHCAIWEKKFYNMYDYSLMTSDIERDKLNEMMNGTKAKTLSVGVDVDYYSQDITSKRDSIGLAYVGNFKVAANVDTLDMVVNKVLPQLRNSYHFYVIGSCPEEIVKQYKDNKDVIFCGRVDDLREYVKKAVIFLSPIAYGTGIKTKIIEAMAMGMPVVTNSVGAEGISAVNNRDFIVRDELSEVASEVDTLILNPDKAQKIGMNAQKFANEKFRWEKIFEVYKEMGL